MSKSKKKKALKCCICGCKIEGYGNNPDGALWHNSAGKLEGGEFAPTDRCCDSCNTLYVIPGRIAEMNFMSYITDNGAIFDDDNDNAIY